MKEIRSARTGRVLAVVPGSLRGAVLSGRKLGWAELDGEYLQDADLSGADLRSASLQWAHLGGARLVGADLRGANLRGCDLTDADLTSANLSRANLVGAVFRRSALAFANLNRATLARTSFLDCDDLHHALRLEDARHRSGSSLDQHTLRISGPNLPQVFLEGAGFTPTEIKATGLLESSYASCFISHASGDGIFASKLYRDLRRRGVLCWHFRHDLRGGLPWQEQVDDAIRVHDKLVLVCSRQATYRPNVVHEILRAIEVERESGNRKLFPIRLDDHILSEATMEEAREKVRSGEWAENWVYYVTRQHVLDFSGWTDPRDYAGMLQRLLDSLRQPDSAP